MWFLLCAFEIEIGAKITVISHNTFAIAHADTQKNSHDVRSVTY